MTKKRKKEIARAIARARKARGWTQREFANKMGMTPQAVSSWEGALSRPRDPARVAGLLGIAVTELI